MSVAFSFNLNAVLPGWFVALLAVALVLLLVHGSRQLRRKNVPAAWVATLAVLRAAVIVVLVLALLQPVVSYSRSSERRPDLLVLIDTSKSMGVAAFTDGRTRLDAARTTLRAGGLLDTLRERYDVHWFAVDRDARPVDDSGLDGLTAEGESTRLADSVATAVAHRGQAGLGGGSAAVPPRVLLVSDGDDLGREDVVRAAERLGVVVDTLALDVADVPEPGAAPRVVLAAVQGPRSVKLGSETQVAVTLRVEGPPGGARQVLLTEDGETLASQSVTFAPGESEKVVRLSHRPTKAGLRKYELRLADGPGAGTGAAPPYAFTVGVVDDKHQVLLLEDSWRWEVKFLRRVIEDDPSFSFTALLPRGAGGGTHTQLAEADRKTTLAGFPQGGADLSWFDTIILGDVVPRRWPPALAEGVARMVREEGKSLVVIAGPNLASLADHPALHALLPVEVTSESARPIEGPVEVRPSREGVASPFFFNVPGGAGALPPLDRVYPPLRKRPAATILLEAAGRTNAYGNLIVAAEHTVGRGRVLFIGTDALWNWQMAAPPDEQGVTPYAAFWQHALRAMAPPPPHSGGGAATLSFQPDRSRYRAGDRVVVRARHASAAGPSSAAPTIRAHVVLPNREQVPLAFEPDPAVPNGYRAEFEATRPGPYTVAGGVGPAGKPAEADALVAIDVEPARDEANSPRVDVANLARIAEGTGGKQVNPSDPATWPTPARAIPARVQQVHTVDLWGNLSLMIVLCALLGTDWLVRLVRGYV